MTKVDKKFPVLLENAVRNGNALIIQNVGETLEALLDPILNKHFSITGGRTFVNIGNNSVQIHSDFKLYLITNLPNPHYTPEVLNKITLINFTVTQEGLKDQMVSITVREEDPQLEEEKLRIMNENAENKQKMYEIE